jgi:hypothetical protein
LRGCLSGWNIENHSLRRRLCWLDWHHLNRAGKIGRQQDSRFQQFQVIRASRLFPAGRLTLLAEQPTRLATVFLALDQVILLKIFLLLVSF